MAVIKHIACKNTNYDAAFDYLTTQYDEFECTVILDEQGSRIPREEFLIEGILCDPFTFGMECQIANAEYGKNQQRNDIKSHHYIISFDPKDKTDNGLTMEKAQELGMDFVKKNFPGHQTLICTHPDGHNGTGNIHVHIIINSLRIENVECPPFKERKSDCLAGMKHHVSKDFMNYLKQDVMEMCRRENLYQVDLLSPAKEKITDREYHAQRRGQARLDSMAAGKAMEISKHKETDATNIIRPGDNKTPSRDDKIGSIPNTKYETQKGFLRRALRISMENSHSIEELKNRLLSDYGIHLSESRGRFSFQIPNRTKPIRARQLGTDFEKESVEKYFEEKKERAAILVLNPAAQQDSGNATESAISLHGAGLNNTILPDNTELQSIDNPPTPHTTVSPQKDDASLHNAAGRQNINDHKIAGILKADAGSTKGTAFSDHHTRDVISRRQPHVTPTTQTTKIPNAGKITTIQKTVVPIQHTEAKESSTQAETQNIKHAVSPDRSEHSTAGKHSAPTPSVHLITDLETCIKAQQNPGYAQKVKISNLKEMTKTMNFLKKNGISSLEELATLVDAASNDTESKKLALKATENRLKTVNLLIKNSGQYFANKKVYSEYLQARNKKAFRETHTTEIMLYEAARKELKALSGGKPIPTMKQLKAEKETLLARKSEQYESFSLARSKRHELQIVQQNVKMILHDDRSHIRAPEQPGGR